MGFLPDREHSRRKSGGSVGFRPTRHPPVQQSFAKGRITEITTGRDDDGEPTNCSARSRDIDENPIRCKNRATVSTRPFASAIGLADLRSPDPEQRTAPPGATQ